MWHQRLTLCFTVACGWECGGARPVTEMKELEYRKERIMPPIIIEALIYFT